MLPTSRDITCAAGDPIPSALANKLQDQIIGHKFPSMAFSIPAGAFIKISGAATYAVATGLWTGVGVYQAWVPAFAGTAIESMLVGYNRGGAGNIFIRERRLNIQTSGITSNTLATINAGTGYTTSTYNAAAFITNPIGLNTPLLIEIEGDNAANVFGGVQITLSRL